MSGLDAFMCLAIWIAYNPKVCGVAILWGDRASLRICEDDSWSSKSGVRLRVWGDERSFIVTYVPIRRINTLPIEPRNFTQALSAIAIAYLFSGLTFTSHAVI
jgi:hypothetical protein